MPPCLTKSRLRLRLFIKTIAQVAEQGDTTLIYVTHHVEEILPCFTHVLLMREGKVFAQGVNKKLLNEIILSEFFNHPIAVQKENGRAWIAVK